MTLTKTPIPTGLVINSQIPLDNKLYFLNEASLSNLGELDNFAFIYYKGMVAYCAQEDTSYKWKEIQEAEEGLLNNNFIYPDNWIKEGINYSNKEYNFVIVKSVTEQNNFVRNILISPLDLPDEYSKQDICDYILTLPESERTIAETDSKLNIIIGYLPV